MAAIIDKLNKRKSTDTETEDILNEIYSLSEQLERAYERFELQSDSNLVDATIFEIEAIKARYRYLLSLAREQNIKAEQRRA